MKTPKAAKAARATAPSVSRVRFGNDDVGNAERLVFYFGHEFRYVPAWDEFLIWQGTHWKKDARQLGIMRLMKLTTEKIRQEASALKGDAQAKRKKPLFAWANHSRQRSRLEAAISLVRSEDGVCVDLDALDKNTWVFNCQSGTIDLRTGELKKHAQRDLLTKISPVRFDPEAKAPRWERWLQQILPEPGVRDYLQRFIGYCLTGQVTERQFVILYGGGRNGKSLLINVLRYILGPYCGPMAPGLLMSRDNEAHPAEVADLFGLRLATSSETKLGRAFDEEQLKRMTGNEELKARLMRENFWSFFPTHKLLLAVNHRPRVRDVTESFWDRAALIPFNVRIAKEKVDKDLFQKLKAEASGILAWMVRGCLEWQRRGLGMPPEIKQATDEYREAEDIVGRFLRECVEFGPTRAYVTTNGGLMKKMKEWCDGLNLYAPGERTVAERLLSLGASRIVNIGSKKERGWRGLRLRTSSEVLGDWKAKGDTIPPMSAFSSDNPDTGKVIPFPSGMSESKSAEGGKVSPGAIPPTEQEGGTSIHRKTVGSREKSSEKEEEPRPPTTPSRGNRARRARRHKDST